MPKYRRGTGSVYTKRGWCYIKYYVQGKAITEAARTKDKAAARRLLQARQGQLAEGRYVGPAVERVTFDELAQDMLTDYTVNGKKSLRVVRLRIEKHLTPFFGGRTAHHMTPVHIQQYMLDRRAGGASNATINRELAALKRMFSLGIAHEKITKKPHMPRLAEDNARHGFFERAECEAILTHLPDDLRPPLTFAFYTGWRIHSEILPLTWRQVDLGLAAISGKASNSLILLMPGAGVEPARF